jgi:transposase
MHFVPRAWLPLALSDEEKARAFLETKEKTMSEPPTEEGYNFSCWTVPLLTEHLQQTLGKTFCGETIRIALHSLGFRWRRPR